jgi:Arc/MetJ-type ribon-helix-helix transcriptional regulator
MKPTDKFDPRRMQQIVDRLRKEGRLPSEEDFIRTAMEVREKFRGEILNATRRKNKVRRPRTS